MNKDGDFDDEYRGVGGTYVIDPATGKRVPVASEQLSVVSCQLPVASDQTPVAGEQLSVVSCQLPVRQWPVTRRRWPEKPGH